MKKLIAGYVDGDARVFSVPDDFTIWPDGYPGSHATSLGWKTDDGWEGWVDTEGLRSLVVMSDETETELLGQPGQLSRLPAHQTETELEPLTLRTDVYPCSLNETDPILDKHDRFLDIADLDPMTADEMVALKARIAGRETAF